jgi:hypothetical protein
MASTTRKAKKKSNAKPRRPVAKKSQPKQGENIQSLQRALDESLAREAATSDILRMIARSPAELQSVLDAIAERAARLCDADDAVVWRVDGKSDAASLTLDRFPPGALWPPSLIAEGLLVERLWTAKRSTSTTFRPPQLNFRVPLEWHWVFAQYSRRHYFTEAWPSALLQFADERSVRSRTGKSSCSKSLRTKP